MRLDELNPKTEELVQKYEKCLQEGSPCYFDVDEFEDISDFYIKKGQSKESRDVVEVGLRVHPNSSILWLRKATLYLEIGEFQRALRILDRLPEKDDADANLVRAECLYRLNRNEEALILLDKIMAEESSERAEMALDISGILVQVGDYQNAIRFLKDALNESPDNIDVLYELAYNYEQLNQTQDAATVYHQILDLDPYSGETWFNLGQSLFNDQKYSEAVEAYDFAMVVNPSDTLSLLQKAHALFQSEKYEEATIAYLEYAKETGTTSAICVYIGETYEKLGQLEAAMAQYQEAYQLEPTNIDALTGMGICLMEQEKFRESLIWFERSLRLDQQISETWVYVAEVFINIDMPEEAMLCYIRSLELDPLQADVLAAIGNLHFDAGTYEKALYHYEQAELINPDLPGLDLFFALAYTKLDNKSEAMKHLEAAINKEPESKKMYDDIINEDETTNPNQTTS